MVESSRRANRRIVSFAIATTVAIALALALTAAAGDPAPGALLVQPQEIRSVGGVVALTLEAAPSVVTVAGRTFTSNVYNGSYLPPVFRLRRGDELRLRLVNRMGPADVQVRTPQATNLHYHGMSISPRPPADDIYITIPALEMIGAGRRAPHAHGMPMRDSHVFDYRWRVPQDHEQGSFWYHSHAHGQAEPQVLSGMSGLFVIDGLTEDWYPWLAGTTERLLLLKDIALPGAADEAPKTKTINGQLDPTIAMVEGRPEIWRIGNIGADAYFDLAIEGVMFRVLERDGNILARSVLESHVFLPPGARATVYVTPPRPGIHRLASRAVDTGPQGDPNPEVTLGHVRVDGSRGSTHAVRDSPPEPGVPVPTRDRVPSAVERLTAQPIARRRTITFSETADGKTFFVDGRQWDIDRVDTVVDLGTVEEWTIRNTSGEAHVFHIHQLDFLVTASNGRPVVSASLVDTVNVPYARNGRPGEVTVRAPFLNPRIVGRFVYHCHILEHEDHGMMANIEVRAPIAGGRATRR